MSQNNDASTTTQWGRTPKRKIKYGPPQPQEGTSAVGPVEDPSAIADPGRIVHAERREPVHVIGSPAPRAHRDPDDGDFKLRDLVGMMAKGLVDHPDDVVVEILSAGDDGVMELHVHPDDLGHVIGKQGRTARSLRLTLGAAAARVDRRVTLEIAD